MPEWKPMGVRAVPAPRRIARAMLQAVYALYLCTGIATLPSVALRAEPAAALAPTALAADIPSQSLAPALENFAHQTGLQIVYVSSVVRDQKTQGVAAGLTPTDALARLLEGTGLRFEFLNERIVRILAVAPPHEVHTHDAPRPETDEVVITAYANGFPKPHIAPATAEELRTLELADKELELHIARDQLLYGHPALDRYVQGVAERLLATDASDAGQTHVRVIKGADANAFALANGSIYLTTALLGALADESELAAVLAHELTHYTNAHMLRALRAEHRQAVAVGTADMLFDVALSLVAAHNGANQPAARWATPEAAPDIWARASVSGYSGRLEREADAGGIHRLVAAGYDASGALASLERLAERIPAERPAVRPMYASHPKIEERIASYRELLAGELASKVGPGGEMRRAEYHAQLAELSLDQVEIVLEAGALDRAEAALEAEMAKGDSGRAEFLKGEIARMRNPQSDATAERALAAYERAVTFQDAPASAYRQAGLLHQLRGESAAASLAFQSYLERAPTAVDAPLVRIYLEELRTPAAMPELRQ